MDKIELLGDACFSHGPYTFYKAVRISNSRVLKLGSFFLTKLWSDADLVSIGELQLLWIDSRGPSTPLASLRLYFLPENTPDGRRDTHGEDEVLTISEKVVVRVHDLVTWLSPSLEWSWGREVSYPPTPSSSPGSSPQPQTLSDPGLDFSDVERHRKDIEGTGRRSDAGCAAQAKVVVLSYARYCRYRSLTRRLEGAEPIWLSSSIAAALGGFTAVPGTRVLFCRDTFDYPDLETHELLCNHLAPKLKGRPRRKRKKRSVSPGESSNESEASVASSIATSQSSTSKSLLARRNEQSSVDEKKFIEDIYNFMNSSGTPLGKMPLLGCRQIDLYLFYSKVQDSGGYEKVSNSRLWKTIYDELGGSTNSTSAATITRKHYERLLLPYERLQRGEDIKIIQSRRSKYSCSSTSEDSVEMKKEIESRSPSTSPTPSEPPNSAADGSANSSETIPPSSSPCELPVGAAVTNVSAVVTLTPPPEKDIKEIKIECKTNHVAQGKENIPLVDKKITKSPEVIDLESEAEIKDKIVIPTLKKRKLEILREGGLEVTAVDLDSRPSVIQACTINNTTTTTTSLKNSAPALSSIPSSNSLLHTSSSGLNEVPSYMQPSIPTPITPKLISVTVTPDIGHMLGSSSNAKDDVKISSTKQTRSSTPSSHKSVNSPNHRIINIGSGGDANLLQYYANAGNSAESHNSDVLSQKYSVSPATQNGRLVQPPKVMQSRSIFSHSQGTIYGNPKEVISPQKWTPSRITVNIPEPHTSRSSSHIETSSSGVLDLTQKPVEKALFPRPNLEIVRVPVVPRPTTNIEPQNLRAKNGYKDKTCSESVRKTQFSNYPVLDTRTMTANNLEITLISPKKEQSVTLQSSIPPNLPMRNSTPTTPVQKRHRTNGKYPNSRSEPVSPYTPRRPANPPVIPNVPNLLHLAHSLNSSKPPSNIYQNTATDKRKSSDSQKEYLQRITEEEKSSVQYHQHNLSYQKHHNQQHQPPRLEIHPSKSNTEDNSQSRRHSMPSISPGFMQGLPIPLSNPAFLSQLSNSSNKFLPMIDPAFYTSAFYNGLLQPPLPPPATAPFLSPEINAYYKEFFESQSRLGMASSHQPPAPTSK